MLGVDRLLFVAVLLIFERADGIAGELCDWLG